MMNRILLLLALIFISLNLKAQLEICDNGIDDDGDGLIDLNDDDCECVIVEPRSLIPNPSFEEMNCCPNDRSQLDCASSWIQASEPTTDFIHLCDWLGWGDFPPPEPFPDGEGIMGFRDGRVVGGGSQPEPYWKEYAGACLTSPLLKDSLYRFQFDVGFVDSQKSPPINISFFGTSNCRNLPFGLGNEAFGCPSNSPFWKKLADVNVSGGPGNRWVNTSLEVTPQEDIYAIAIGPDCPPVSSTRSIYYFFDNLVLANFESFDLQITENQHPCSNDFTLSVPFNSDFKYQWYKYGVALQGEVFSEMTQNYGEGDYQVTILEGPSCRTSVVFEYRIPVIDAPSQIAICEGDNYKFGDIILTEPGAYLDTFRNVNGCDSIVNLDLTVIGARYDTLEVSIFEGQTFQIGSSSFNQAGEYPLTLTSSLGCDSLVFLKLSNFNIHIPNAFSPNEDGINDVFEVYGPDEEILSIEISIFDRWGNLIFKGERWRGHDQQPGVYAYVVEIQFIYGSTEITSGSITLFR